VCRLGRVSGTLRKWHGDHLGPDLLWKAFLVRHAVSRDWLSMLEGEIVQGVTLDAYPAETPGLLRLSGSVLSLSSLERSSMSMDTNATTILASRYPKRSHIQRLSALI